MQGGRPLELKYPDEQTQAEAFDVIPENEPTKDPVGHVGAIVGE